MNSDDKAVTIVVCSVLGAVLLIMGGCAHYDNAEKIEALRNDYEQTMEPSTYQRVWKKR